MRKFVSAFYSYGIGAIVALVAAKVLLFRIGSINLGEELATWSLFPLVVILLSIPPYHPSLTRRGAWVTFTAVFWMELVERFIHSRTDEWLSPVASSVLFLVVWIISIILSLKIKTENRREEQK